MKYLNIPVANADEKNNDFDYEITARKLLVENYPYTHIVLTKEEYDGMEEEIKILKSRLTELDNNHLSEIKNLKRQNEEAILDIEEKLNKRIMDLEAERDLQAGLNNNLLRICKERANAKRGLQPKKRHPGYRIVGRTTQIKTPIGYERGKGPQYADVWTATMETPYDGTLPIKQIESKIFQDLMGPDGVLARLQVEYFSKKENGRELWKGTYNEATEIMDISKSYLFDYRFSMNASSRLWEVQISTTNSIHIPSEMI